jgi:hypothetical protein
VDTVTGKRASLGTTNEDEARQIIEARNNSHRQWHAQSANCPRLSHRHRPGVFSAHLANRHE